MKPLTLYEITRAVGGTLTQPALGEAVVTQVSTDTRSVPAGALFVPITGRLFDGHDFIDEAFAKGAACVFTHKAPAGDRPCILVEDTTRALLALAAYYKSLFRVKTIAVTGSTGKTTTKDMIAAVLSKRFSVLKNIGNLNNHVGLPRTLFGLEDCHEVAVLEMGMNNPGEIGRLSVTARPDAVVFTNIGDSHIGRLGSREAILAAKCEALLGLRGDKRVHINGDDPLLRTIDTRGLNPRYYGFDPTRGHFPTQIEKKGVYGIEYTLNGPEGAITRISVPLPGTHTVYNSLAAASVALDMGLSPEEVRQGLMDFTPSGLRLNITECANGVTVIDDAYNASPDSVRAALEVLSQARGRRLCVLGDMLELGPSSPEMHREAGRLAVSLGTDVIICIGAESAHTYQEAKARLEEGGGPGLAYYFPDAGGFLDALPGMLRDGDTVLVKASRAMRFEDITSRILEAGGGPGCNEKGAVTRV